MAIATFDNILSDLKKQVYHPIYFLSGDEPYYIDQISQYIQDNVLNETEKTFNLSVLYGKDAEVRNIIDSAKRFPMMSTYQVVIVKEAQELKNFENLAHYIEQPLKSTLLVICYKYKSLDKRKKIAKIIQKNGVYLESKKLYDDKLPGWISTHLSAKKYSIQPKAAALLGEFLGSDLSKISNELDKLIITLDENERTISPEHIEKNIGISKDYNIFELQAALGKKDVLKANRIINYFAENQKENHITKIISSLYFFFSKVLIYYWIKDKSKENVFRTLKLGNIYFVNQYVEAAGRYNPTKVIQVIEILRDYEMKSKGFEGNNHPAGELLKEMTFKILH
jgi:DNA polymerase III subunit delta